MNSFTLHYAEVLQVGMAMRALGLNPTESEVYVGSWCSLLFSWTQSAINDVGGDSHVGFSPFLTIMGSRFGKSENLEPAKAAFKVFDKVCPGCLCVLCVFSVCGCVFSVCGCVFFVFVRVLQLQDGSGINGAELRHILTQLGDRLTDEEADEVLKEAGFDSKDASIDIDNFIRVMTTGSK